jgi:cellulose synthase/poly-beta-1,6-N-acetylglucosamine synthase-like glycosyltransferase/peptidoglycan/xylan/chitin deacetylase (PgdA/CDA1 family)
VAQGVTTRTLGASGTPAAGDAGSAGPLSGTSSLLAVDQASLSSRGGPAGRRIVLTFDDGPDAHWTPRIAALLKRLGVPATFFLSGAEVARHPGIVRDLHSAGFELGNHTFTHAELASIPAWQRRLQIAFTESAIAGAAGVRPRLVRPPYSGTPDAVTSRQRDGYLDLARRGYVIALTDLDSRDWTRPGVEEIVRRSTPPGQEGGLVLMHDGAGDRAQTLAALGHLVPRLRARGFRFVKASELAGLTPAEAEPPASAGERLRGRLLLGALAVSRAVTTVLTVLLLVVAALAAARALLLIALARRHAGSARPAWTRLEPAASIIVPAFNESVGIARAVQSLAASDYPDFEVVVVDDGSDDGTAEIVEALALANVHVIQQPNHGKSAALNRGIVAAEHDLIVTVDADTIFEPDTLRRLLKPFAEPAVGAVSGNTKVGNRGGLIGRWQHIEYVMGFNLDRRLYDVLQCMPTVPGAIGAFRRKALTDIGGMSSSTLAEDTDATLAVGRAGWRVVYTEDARAWTETPGSLGALWRQRYRWSYGTLQAVWKHRGALIRRGERRIGRRGLPYLVLFQILLPALAPLIDLFALYGIVFLDPVPVLGYWGAFNALHLALGWYAFRLDDESPRALWALPLQQFVYRQLMYLVVIESIVSALLGTRLRWQHVERRGDVEVPA